MVRMIAAWFVVAGLVLTPVPAEAKTVLVNFEGTQLVKVIKWMSKKTGKNFVLEDELRDHRITIISGSRVTIEEAYQAFLDALDAEGFHVSEEGKFHKITRRYRRPSRKPGGGISLGDCPPPVGITQVDDTHWSIGRATLEGWFANTECLGRQARIVPSFKDGESQGFKLYAIRQGTLYEKMGLKNGDTIVKLNGMEITTPDQALEAYTQIRNADKITVELLRRGNPRTLTYEIR